MWVVLILLAMWATYKILDWALFDLIEICDGELAVRQCESEILLPEKLLPGRYRIFRWQRHEWSILDTKQRYAVIVVGSANPDTVQQSSATTIMCHYKLASPRHTAMIQRNPGHNRLYPLFEDLFKVTTNQTLSQVEGIESIQHQIQKKARRLGLDIQEIRIINSGHTTSNVVQCLKSHSSKTTNKAYTTRPVYN